MKTPPSSSIDALGARLKGGGGNFGVATRFKYRLHEVEQIVGGMLFLPATADVIASLVEETTTAPDELTAMVNVMKAPPMPFIPEEHHGRVLVMILLAYAGDLDEGDRIVDRLSMSKGATTPTTYFAGITTSNRDPAARVTPYFRVAPRGGMAPPRSGAFTPM